MDLLKELEKERKERPAPDVAGDIKPKWKCIGPNEGDSKNKMSIIQVSPKVNNNMDIRDFLKKVDNIQNKEQMKEDVKRIPGQRSIQVMLYGDTP